MFAQMLSGALQDAGNAALKLLKEQQASQAAQTKAPPPPLSVSLEDVTAELAELNLVLGEKLGKGRRVCRPSAANCSFSRRAPAAEPPCSAPSAAPRRGVHARVGQAGSARQARGWR